MKKFFVLLSATLILGACATDPKAAQTSLSVQDVKSTEYNPRKPAATLSDEQQKELYLWTIESVHDRLTAAANGDWQKACGQNLSRPKWLRFKESNDTYEWHFLYRQFFRALKAGEPEVYAKAAKDIAHNKIGALYTAKYEQLLTSGYISKLESACKNSDAEQVKSICQKMASHLSLE